VHFHRQLDVASQHHSKPIVSSPQTHDHAAKFHYASPKVLHGIPIRRRHKLESSSR